MEVDADQLKIAELERSLREEKDRYDLLQSQSDFAKFLASQGIDKYRRECLSLKESVARLSEDYATVRERELRDQETIEGLMEAMERKEKLFTEKFVELKTEIRDLDCGKRRAQREGDEWKKKCAELEARLSKSEEKFALLVEQNRDLEDRASKLSDENRRLKEQTKGKEHGDLESRILKLVQENFHLQENATEKEQSFATSNGKHASEVDEGSTKRSKRRAWEDLVVVDSDSDVETDWIRRSSPLRNKGLNDSGSLSDECAVSEAVADERTPLGLAKDSEVSSKGAQGYRKRKLNNETSERGYTGRVPSYEQCQQAKKRAKALQSNLSSCNPSFVKPMAQSHVSGAFWFSVPANFCKDNLPACTLEMMLEDVNGLEHGVKYMGHSNAFSGGWRRFALDHNLELGDTLIFELSEPLKFKVYIIKAIPEASCQDSDNKIAHDRIHGTNKWVKSDNTGPQDVDLSDHWKDRSKAEHPKQPERSQEYI